MVLPNERLGLTRPPIVLLCFGSLIQVYISSQCFTPVFTIAQKSSGNFLGRAMAVWVVTEKEREEETGETAGRIDDPSWVNF